MTNEMVGEVWNGQRNSVMPFGETVADATKRGLRDAALEGTL